MNWHPWYRWPSWVTELLSGLVTVVGVLLLRLAFARWPDLTLLGGATLASIVYERSLDAHGWSWKDVLQRQVGITLGVGVVWLMR